MWYDPGAFKSCAQALGSKGVPPDVDWQPELKTHGYAVMESPTLWCPGCGERMEKARFYDVADLIVDTCEGCGGHWAADKQLRRAAVYLRYEPQPDPPKPETFEETGGLSEGERKAAFVVSMLNPFSLTFRLPYHTNVPIERKAIVLNLLSIACVAVYFLQPRDPQEAFYFLRFFALTPAIVAGGSNYHSFLTHMFLHAGIFHLAGNLYFLRVFGRNVESGLGHRDFMILYFVTGLCAALVYTLLRRESGIPMLGASGAVSGILGGYLSMYPDSKVNIWLRGKQVRNFSARFYLGLWFALQAFWYLREAWYGRSSGVAFTAHLGGFAAGWLLAPDPLPTQSPAAAQATQAR